MSKKPLLLFDERLERYWNAQAQFGPLDVGPLEFMLNEGTATSEEAQSVPAEREHMRAWKELNAYREETRYSETTSIPATLVPEKRDDRVWRVLTPARWGPRTATAAPLPCASRSATCTRSSPSAQSVGYACARQFRGP